MKISMITRRNLMNKNKNVPRIYSVQLYQLDMSSLQRVHIVRAKTCNYIRVFRISSGSKDEESKVSLKFS